MDRIEPYQCRCLGSEAVIAHCNGGEPGFKTCINFFWGEIAFRANQNVCVARRSTGFGEKFALRFGIAPPDEILCVCPE